MEINKKIHKYTFIAFLATFGLGACTADHAYKTSITPEEFVEQRVKTYESEFFRVSEKNSIITVSLDPESEFDQFELMGNLESVISPMDEVHEMDNPLILITDSQNRSMNNPWLSLNDSIAYRIEHYYLPNRLHLKATYTKKGDGRTQQFYSDGIPVSRETAAEAGLMPVWNKMMAIAREYGDDISVE